MKYSRSQRRQLEHLIVGAPREPAWSLDDPRIGGVDAIDVRENLASRGSNTDGERNGARIGSSATERRHLEIRSDSLKPRHDDDSTVR